MAAGRADTGALSSVEGDEYIGARWCVNYIGMCFIQISERMGSDPHAATVAAVTSLHRPFSPRVETQRSMWTARLSAVGSAVLGGDARHGHHREECERRGSPSEAMMGESAVAPGSTSFAQASAPTTPGVSRFHGDQKPHS